MTRRPLQNIAVVGIGGVGKEYIRALVEFGLGSRLVLVDTNEGLNEHIGDGGEVLRLANTFPGYEFVVQIRKETPQLSVDQMSDGIIANALDDFGVSHVFHATPPHARSLFERTAEHFTHHVEKPYMSKVALEDVSVGYQYHRYTFAENVVHAVAPNLGGWREAHLGFVPLVWDLGGHAISLTGHEWWSKFHLEVDMDGTLSFKADGGPRVMIAYSALAASATTVDYKTLDWRKAFDSRLANFLGGRVEYTSAPEAIELEGHLARLEGEILASRESLRSTASDESGLAGS